MAHRAEYELKDERYLAILWGEITLGDPEAGGIRLVQDCPQQAGLADAGLAGQQQEMSLARGRLGDPAIGQVEQLVATDEERAQERTDSAHWREV